MSAPLPPILLVGGGKMGAALLAGWQAHGLAPSVVVDPAGLAAADVTVVAAPEAIPAGFVPAVMVFAVKPQVAEAVLPAYGRFAGRALTLSIMAGQTLARLAQLVGPGPAVRAMPNTPAAIGQGFTAAFACPAVDAAQRALASTLLGAVGEVAWVDTEAQIDAVTAISGGGPAYVFLLTELLEQAALEQGLPPALARRMARQTVTGAGALLAARDDDPAAMRRAVTSPNGTTERALAVLMADWPPAVSRAIQAATDRSRELSA